MALQPFSWGAGGQKASPSSIKRQAEIAAALAARGGTPQNLGEGLNRIGEALLANSYNARAAAGEEEGAAARKAFMEALLGNSDPTMADIAGGFTNEWVASDPGSSAVLQALLGAEMQQNDPLRQLQMQQAQRELDAPTIINDQAVDSTTMEVLGDFRTPAAGPTPTDDQREYTQAVDQGFVGTLQDWLALKPSSSTNVTVNNGGTDDFYKKLDTDLGAQQVELIDAGTTAQSNNMRLGQLEQHLSNAPQGAAGGFVQMAGQLGIPMDGLSDIQAAQAIINQMVPGQRPPGSGTMSDADLALFKASLPAIMNQPGGNAAIIQTSRAINEYTIALAEIARQVANREITPAEGRAAQAEVPNPLADFKGPAASETPAGNFDYNAETPPEGWGGNPELWKHMPPEDRALW